MCLLSHTNSLLNKNVLLNFIKRKAVHQTLFAILTLQNIHMLLLCAARIKCQREMVFHKTMSSE